MRTTEINGIVIVMATPLASSKDSLYSIWRSYCTIIELLHDRSYDVDHLITGDEGTKVSLAPSLTFQDFEEKYEDQESAREDLQIEAFSKAVKDKKICVYWRSTIGTTEVKTLYEELKSTDTYNAIIVYAKKKSAYADALIRNIRADRRIIETFSEQELQFNVTHHKFVPKHIICSLKTKTEVEGQYGSLLNFPKIKITDPVARYLGAKQGNLIKIIRPSDSIPSIMVGSGTTKKEVALMEIGYRYVVRE